MLEDRIAIRLPWLYTRFASFVWRLPVGSRLRRVIVERAVERSYSALGRGDLAALHAMYHPECCFDFSRFENWPDRTLYEGHEGLDRLVHDLQEVWGDFRYELTEMRMAGEHVLSSCRMRARGGHTRIDLEMTFSQVSNECNGLALRVDNYTDHAGALEAVGLSE